MAAKKGGTSSTPEGAGNESAPEGVSDEVIEAEFEEQLPQPRNFEIDAAKREEYKVDTRLSRPVGDGGELSGMDERLLQMASMNKTPREMGNELGIPPAKAAARVKEIIDAKDWLNVLQKEVLILDEMHSLSQLISNIVDADLARGDRPDPRFLSLKLKTLTALLAQVNKRRETQAQERKEIRDSHASAMGQAIEAVFSRFAFEMVKQYKDFNEEQARDTLAVAIPRGFESIEKRMKSDDD